MPISGMLSYSLPIRNTINKSASKSSEREK